MLLCRRCLLLILAVALAPTAATAQRDLEEIPVPDPELERATFVLPDGFEVNLWAADPELAKPIQMNFDPQGRLWVAASEVYPQIKPGQEPTDKVLVLEDSDGDGVSDRTTVFAEGLLIPTGIAPGDGGVYVGASTELLHFRDTNGDLKADEQRVVLSGFGTEDTHHILHTLRWGPEQRLYFSQSVYIHSHIETPWGVQRLNAGGIWRLNPATLQLDVFARGLVNTWGTDFDAFGTTFATDGAGNDGINYMLPGAYYEKADAAPRVLRGLNPGSPKHCGLEIVGGSHLPDDWQGSFLTSDFRGHRVCRFVLTPRGSGFVSQEQPELIKSDHVAFRPIDAKLGPDGAIYIADWYNPIIQHGEVDFRDPRRDHTHGRIWRVTCRDRPPAARVDLLSLATPELIDQLRSQEPWLRRQAQRVLTERGPSILPMLKLWARELDNSQPNYHRHRLEALWLYQAFDVVEPELLTSLLRCSTPDVRAAACRVAGDWQDRLPDALDLLAARADDEHPRVRLEAVRALAKLTDPRLIEAALQPLDGEVDVWLDYALWQTAHDTAPLWQPALKDGRIDFGGSVRKRAFALMSAGSSESVPELVRLLASGQIGGADRDAVLGVISEFGGPDDLQQLLDLCTDASTTAVVVCGALDALRIAAARHDRQPAGNTSVIGKLLRSANADVSARAIALAGTWRVRSLWEPIAHSAQDTDGDTDLRLAALSALAAYGSERSAILLLEIADGTDAAPIRLAAVEHLATLQPAPAAELAVRLIAESSALPVGDVQQLLRTFLSLKDGPSLLTAALSGQQWPADAGVLALRTLNESGRQFPELTAAINAAAGIDSLPRPLSDEERSVMIAAVQNAGDPARGEAIFRRDELACLKCHAVGNAGGLVGPNLVSLGTASTLDYIVDSLFDPGKAVKEGYHTVVVATTKGQVLSGIKVRDSDNSLILRDAEDRELAIPLDEIDSEAQGVSLMPAGLVDKLTRPELVDLVAFLAALGRLPEFTVSREQVARRWEVLLPTEAGYQLLRKTRHASAAGNDPALTWQIRYSRVNGALPVEELPALPFGSGVTFVRCALVAHAAGTLELRCDDVTGLTAWLDEQPLELLPQSTLSLTGERHRLTLAIDRGQRTTGLRLELPAGEGPPIAEFVSGK